jgi:hypothetical protein
MGGMMGGGMMQPGMMQSGMMQPGTLQPGMMGYGMQPNYGGTVPAAMGAPMSYGNAWKNTASILYHYRAISC